jgi:hypothetical protein
MGAKGELETENSGSLSRQDFRGIMSPKMINRERY